MSINMIMKSDFSRGLYIMRSGVTGVLPGSLAIMLSFALLLLKSDPTYTPPKADSNKLLKFGYIIIRAGSLV